jgi:hypothetical protein
VMTRAVAFMSSEVRHGTSCRHTIANPETTPDMNDPRERRKAHSPHG